eukprot:m.25956 g.25956  ORF g.25956 m.25956 type:complete len:339 (+) comp9844_c0_seq1:298-1314(+)
MGRRIKHSRKQPVTHGSTKTTTFASLPSAAAQQHHQQHDKQQQRRKGTSEAIGMYHTTLKAVVQTQLFKKAKSRSHGGKMAKAEAQDGVDNDDGTTHRNDSTGESGSDDDDDDYDNKKCVDGDAAMDVETAKELKERLDTQLHKYQLVSLQGAKAFDSSVWVKRELKKIRPTPKEGKKVRLLDVGALQMRYDRLGWLDATYIDLHSQEPGITQIDFFDVDEAARFDVVVLSLVLNFVPDAHQRGEMLRKCTRMLAPTGLLFVVLPLPCVANSRYCTESHLLAMLAALGFSLHSRHESRKLAFFALTFDAANQLPADAISFPRTLLRTGASRNNFAILL